MTWRVAIRHRTGYEYEGEVVASYNVARLTPCSADGQLLLEHSIRVDPLVPTFPFVDYWQTRVHAFDVHVPHQRLSVISRSLVETAAARPAPPAIDWSVVRDPRCTDELCEFLAPSAMTKPDDAIAALAADLRDSLTPNDTVGAVVDWVRTNLRYERGVTGVETPATGVLTTRRGVCQDFAHLTISLLRATGLPARYVSGYVHPERDGAPGTPVNGESHAWVEVWVGDWWGVDPTNGDAVGPRHVRVAHGRDYTDVAPLAGIFHGAPSKALRVEVELTRVA